VRLLVWWRCLLVWWRCLLVWWWGVLARWRRAALPCWWLSARKHADRP